MIYEEERESLLKDLYDVGTTKSLGYLPLKTLTGFCKVNTQEIIDFVTEKENLNYLLFDEKYSKVSSGCICVYHEKMLLDKLDEYHIVLKEAGVPTDDAKEYIQYIIKNTVHQEIFPLAYIAIGKTFNDERFKDSIN